MTERLKQQPDSSSELSWGNVSELPREIFTLHTAEEFTKPQYNPPYVPLFIKADLEIEGLYSPELDTRIRGVTIDR